MATRFYFAYSDAAPVSPAIDAGWDYTSEQTAAQIWQTVKQGDALAHTAAIGPLSGTAGDSGIAAQYVSGPLDAQTISGTVKGQLMAHEGAGTDNINQIIIVLKVVSNDGTTVRGTLLAHGSYGPTAEFSAGGVMRNKKIADGDTITSVDAEAGDRLVLEIGASNSVTGTTPEFFFRLGDDATDLPEDETTTTDLAGWFEFSDDITFQTGGQTIAIGQVTETDTAQVVAWAPKIRALGQISEADTAQALSRLKTLDIGQASETDTAQAIAAPAFPVVAARNNSVETSTVTSHDVSLPAGIDAGDLLIVQFSVPLVTSFTWPAGWTLVASAGVTLSQVRYRVADGTEGATITITTGSSRRSVHRSWRITDQHATAAPEATVVASGFDAAPNSPNLAPSWSAADTLWLATCAVDQGPTFSGFPAGYGNTSSQNSGADLNLHVSDAIAERNLNAASENPGTFVISTDRTWHAFTIAIRPVADAGIITIGQTSETDTASALTRKKTQDIAAAEEADTVSALGRKKSVTIGQVSEADTAQPVAWNPKIRLLGQALETDTAQVITSPGAIGQAEETDTAQAFTHRKTRLIGQVTETDTAQVVGKRKVKATGQVSEADTAQALIVILRETWRVIRPQAGGTLTPPTTGTITPPVTQTLTRP